MGNKIVKSCSVIEDYIILFLFVFGLTLPVVRTSSLMLILYLPFRVLYKKKTVAIWKVIARSNYVQRLVLIYSAIVFLILWVTILQIKFDFSLVTTIINNIIHLIIASLIVALWLSKGRSIHYVLSVIVGIFVIQSIIEIAAFSDSSVLTFVQSFQSEATVDLADKFSGRRGLALAGTVFFGLSTIYGLIFIFISRLIVEERRVRIGSIVAWGIIVVGGFFTGRTFFIGVFFGLVYLAIAEMPLHAKRKGLVKTIAILFCLILIALFLIPEDMYKKINDLFLYVFEAVFNYINTGHATTTSSEHLVKDMFFYIPPKTILLGDGQYTGAHGEYYMQTDSGYMRNVLLFGVLGLILCMVLDIYLLWGSNRLRDKSISTFSGFIFLYMLILHIKGETFAYLLTFHCMLFVFYLFYEFMPSKYLNSDFHRKIHKQHFNIPLGKENIIETQ